MAYGPDSFCEKQVDAQNIGEHLGKWPVIWINVDGLGDVDTIRKLGEVFKLHPLALEDVLHVHQRAKLDLYDEYHFLVAHMVTWQQGLQSEQLSLFLGRNFVLTFQEGRPGDAFDPIRERIRKGASRMRTSGSDYLAYCLLDAVIDGYFPLLEEIGERLESLESDILERPVKRSFQQVHDLKRELLSLRRAVWPLREAVNEMVRDPSDRISDETRLHLRDCYDHTVRVIDFVETYRELGSDLMDLYLSSVSQRMTEVMKVLTIIATIFIPLTFISSIYGMNFNTQASPWNMPELNWYYGYPLALLAMAVVGAAFLVSFWHRGWLGRDASIKRSDEPAEGS
jgi:magnesium transporter